MKRSMEGRDIIVIGASAGGVEAMLSLMQLLPSDLPASIFVVIHLAATRPSMLAEILGRASRLHVMTALDSEAIEPGRVYVAPPDNHLLVSPGFVRVVRGAMENGHRPAVDPLFRTAARAYGGRVIGVVLTGMRDCGTAGLQEIKRHGGVAVVQDPADALFPSMPQSAVDNVEVDHCLALEEIPALLARLTREPPPPPPTELPEELEELEGDFTCPGCGGHLTRKRSGAVLNFGCKVGHRYSPEGLVAEQTAALEMALWTALRTIEDSTALARRMMARSLELNRPHATARFEERVRHGEAQAALVRQALLGSNAEGKGKSKS